MAQLIGGKIAGDIKPDESQENDRYALHPGRRAVVPSGRDIGAGHTCHKTDARHGARKDCETDHQQTNQGIIEISRSAWRPEDQGREQQPQPDHRVGDARPRHRSRQR